MADVIQRNQSACDAIRDSLQLLFDGELPQEKIETVVSHSADCERCAEEIAALDRLHLLIKGVVEAHADKVDDRALWRCIEARLPRPRAGWWVRLRDGWLQSRWEPAFAGSLAALAVVMLVVGLSWRGSDAPAPAGHSAVQLAAHGGGGMSGIPAEIMQIETDYPVVTVLNDETHSAAVIWVSDEGFGEGQW